MSAMGGKRTLSGLLIDSIGLTFSVSAGSIAYTRLRSSFRLLLLLGESALLQDRDDSGNVIEQFASLARR